MKLYNHLDIVALALIWFSRFGYKLALISARVANQAFALGLTVLYE